MFNPNSNLLTKSASIGALLLAFSALGESKTLSVPLQVIQNVNSGSTSSNTKRSSNPSQLDDIHQAFSLVSFTLGGQSVTSIVDTGSSILWVGDKNSTDVGFTQGLCAANGCYSLTESSPTNLNTAQSIQYAQGTSVSIEMYEDSLSIAGVSVADFEFGFATQYPEFNHSVFGLRRMVGTDGSASLTSLLKKDGFIDSDSFSLSYDGPLQLSLSNNDVIANGEIVFGGYNSSKMTGSMNTFAIDVNSEITSMTSISLKGSTSENSYLASVSVSENVVLDSGTTNALIFPGLNAILDQINMTNNAWNCTTYKDYVIDFDFNGTVLEIPINNLAGKFNDQCYSFFEDGDVGVGLLGQFFMTNVLSYWDYDSGVVGIAPANSDASWLGDTTSTSTAATSAATSAATAAASTSASTSVTTSSTTATSTSATTSSTTATSTSATTSSNTATSSSSSRSSELSTSVSSSLSLYSTTTAASTSESEVSAATESTSATTSSEVSSFITTPSTTVVLTSVPTYGNHTTSSNLVSSTSSLAESTLASTTFTTDSSAVETSTTAVSVSEVSTSASSTTKSSTTSSTPAGTVTFPKNTFTKGKASFKFKISNKKISSFFVVADSAKNFDFDLPSFAVTNEDGSKVTPYLQSSSSKKLYYQFEDVSSAEFNIAFSEISNDATSTSVKQLVSVYIPLDNLKRDTSYLQLVVALNAGNSDEANSIVSTSTVSAVEAANSTSTATSSVVSATSLSSTQITDSQNTISTESNANVQASSTASASAASNKELTQAISVVTNGPAVSMSTVSQETTTVITLTSCSDDLCSISSTTALLSVATTTIKGEVTEYTTYCPLTVDMNTASSSVAAVSPEITKVTLVSSSSTLISTTTSAKSVFTSSGNSTQLETIATMSGSNNITLSSIYTGAANINTKVGGTLIAALIMLFC